MHLLIGLAALLLLVAVDPVSAQTHAEKVRITVWYAQLLVTSTERPQGIVFVLPNSAPDNPRLDSLLRLLRPAFQQAALPITSEDRAPGRDTLLVLLGAPEIDSVTSVGTYYTLFSSQKDGSTKDRTGIYASRLRCVLEKCQFLSQQPVGGGSPARRARAQGLPPNKRMQQTDARLADSKVWIGSTAPMRNERLSASSTAPAAYALIR